MVTASRLSASASATGKSERKSPSAPCASRTVSPRARVAYEMSASAMSKEPASAGPGKGQLRNYLEAGVKKRGRLTEGMEADRVRQLGRPRLEQ